MHTLERATGPAAKAAAGWARSSEGREGLQESTLPCALIPAESLTDSCTSLHLAACSALALRDKYTPAQGSGQIHPCAVLHTPLWSR